MNQIINAIQNYLLIGIITLGVLILAEAARHFLRKGEEK